MGLEEERRKKKSLQKIGGKEKREINSLRTCSGTERKKSYLREKSYIKGKMTASQKAATITKGIGKGLTKRG